MIRGLWERGIDELIDVQIVNTDSVAHRDRTSEAVLKTAERSKKKKDLAHCQQQRRHFTPFIVSTDRLLGDEANAVVKRLATVLSQKWETAYSRVCGWLRSRIGIAIVQATHRCLRGSRIPRDSMSTPEDAPEERRTGQAPCPPGAWCTAGKAIACTKGTYAYGTVRSDRGSCLPCPPESTTRKAGPSRRTAEATHSAQVWTHSSHSQHSSHLWTYSSHSLVCSK